MNTLYISVENREDGQTNDNNRRRCSSDMSQHVVKPTRDVTDNTYGVYVLVVLTVTYLVNQCDM